MKTIKTIAIALLAIVAMASCSNNETYADQKKKERAAINRYIADQKINVISEATFYAQDSTTDVSKNQYVLFDNTGVYMQIERKGCGAKLKNGETATVLCRFYEYNILEGDSALQLTNITQYNWLVDKMTVKNTSGTFTASFLTGESLMYTRYSSAAVPAGWLVPLTYVNLGRPVNEDDQVAKVRLIVPHTQGQSDASQNVYPCLYELTMQRGR